jgi:hypothetical protein
MKEREALRIDDMDVVGGLFAFRFVGTDQVELYTEMKMANLPDWMIGLGSDKRYTPKLPWTRKAYLEGLRDAMRIAEREARAHAQKGLGPELNCRRVVKAVHDRAVEINDGH